MVLRAQRVLAEEAWWLIRAMEVAEVLEEARLRVAAEAQRAVERVVGSEQVAEEFVAALVRQMLSV